jgi:putative solute:sodium symporter small subunit
MKHVVNILLLVIWTGLTVGLSYLCYKVPEGGWPLLFFPVCSGWIFLFFKMIVDYDTQE